VPTVSATPKPAPPSVPTAATVGLTIPAAEAFARFYLGAVDYLAATGDANVVRDWSDKECAACNALANAYEQTYKNGGSLSGQFRARIVSVDQVRLIRKDTAAVVIKAAQGRHQWLKSAGSAPTDLPGGPVTFDMTLAAKDGRWIMYEIVIKK